MTNIEWDKDVRSIAGPFATISIVLDDVAEVLAYEHETGFVFANVLLGFTLEMFDRHRLSVPTGAVHERE